MGKKWNYKNSLDTHKNCTIVDETSLDGTKRTVSASISFGISADGSANLGGALSKSYTYNSETQTIDNCLGGKYAKTWKATPDKNTKDGSYKLGPAMSIKNTNGKKSKTTVTLSVPYFCIGGDWKNYNWKPDNCKLSLNFKNHKKV